MNNAEETRNARTARPLTIAAPIILAVTLVAAGAALWAQSAASQAVPAQPSVPEWQTAAGGKLAFDVASVKENKSGSANGSSNILLTPGDVLRPTGGRFSLTNAQLRQLIQFAYKLPLGAPVYLVPALPDRLDAERFDIEAKADASTGKDQFRLMVQSLLADRFKLMVHRETRQRPVYALVLSKAGKTGPQLKPHTDETPCAAMPSPPAPGSAPTPSAKDDGWPPPVCGSLMSRPVSGRWRMAKRNVTMGQIAGSLWTASNAFLDRPVLDQTGLSGKLDFRIEFTSQFQTDPTGTTFLEALAEQLGLKLVPTTGPVDVLVVDHVEEPSAN